MKSGDYFILDTNVVPGVPKAAYTPRIGHLVRRETAQDNEWDLATTDEVFAGIIVAVNSNNTVISVAELIPGTTIILPFAAPPALGDKVEAGATALVDVGTMGIQRTLCVVDNLNGVGAVIDVSPVGANTGTVRF